MPDPTPTRAIRCLLADDDREIRQLLADYLRPFGMQIEPAVDAGVMPTITRGNTNTRRR